MSKRVILLLTFDYGDADPDVREHVAVVVKPSRAEAMKRIKELVKEDFAKRFEDEDGRKLGRYERRDDYALGYFGMKAQESGLDCEEFYIVSEVPYAEVS